MSESNNNIPMRITQLEEATAYEEGMYYAVAKAGGGTKKIDASLKAGLYVPNAISSNAEMLFQNQSQKLYDEMYLFKGTKALSNNQIIWTAPDLSDFSSVQCILFGALGVSVPDYILNENVDPKLTLEFTYSTDATISLNVTDKNNVNVAKGLEKGNNIKVKYTYDMISIKYISLIMPSNSDANKNITFSNVILYYGNEYRETIYQALENIENEINLDNIPNENIQVLSYNNEENIFQKSIATLGTKTLSNNIINWELPDSEEYTGNPQFIIFGVSTTNVKDYQNSETVPDTLTFEFDYTTDATLHLYLYDKNNVMKSLALSTGENIHCKFSNENIESIKYLYISSLFSTNAGKNISIWNLKLYYGDKFGTNIKDFCAETQSIIKGFPKYKSILTIGDSLTNISGNANSGAERWQDYILNECCFDSFITEGAVGFTVAQLQGQSSIYDVVQSLTRNDDVDFVTFWGGTNDWGVNVQIGNFAQNIENQNNYTFYGALISCIKKLCALYPDKRIILIGTTPRMTNSTIGDFSTRGAVNQNGDTLIDFVDAVKKVAEYYSLPFINLMNTSGINDLNYQTYLYEQSYSGQDYSYYLHFTNEGEILIGRTISGFIKSLI